MVAGHLLLRKFEVSDAINGKSSAPWGSTCGKVRPVYPHQLIQLFDASNGLGVDELVERL